MRILALATALSLAASPATLLAQEVPPEDDIITETAPGPGQLADTLTDPQVQARLVAVMGVLSETLLDLPLAPLAEAAAEMSGQDAGDIDPDMTLRRMAPEAEALPDEISEKLPVMMNSMAAMANGLEAMLPALRDMAAQMEDAMAGSGRGAE